MAEEKPRKNRLSPLLFVFIGLEVVILGVSIAFVVSYFANGCYSSDNYPPVSGLSAYDIVPACVTITSVFVIGLGLFMQLPFFYLSKFQSRSIAGNALLIFCTMALLVIWIIIALVPYIIAPTVLY